MLRSISKYSILFNSVDSELFTLSPLVQVWPQRCRMTWMPETEKSLGNCFNSLRYFSALFFLQYSLSDEIFFQSRWLHQRALVDSSLSLLSDARVRFQGSGLHCLSVLYLSQGIIAETSSPILPFVSPLFYSPSIQICYSTSRSYNCILELISSPFLHQKSCVLDFHIRDYMIRVE